MTDPTPPRTLADLLALHTFEDEAPDPPAPVSLAEVLAGRAADPGGVVGYIRGLGIPVATLADVERINDDPGEEELRAHRVAEGVAVSVASEGAWHLLVD